MPIPMTRLITLLDAARSYRDAFDSLKYCIDAECARHLIDGANAEECLARIQGLIERASPIATAPITIELEAEHIRQTFAQRQYYQKRKGKQEYAKAKNIDKELELEETQVQEHKALKPPPWERAWRESMGLPPDHFTDEELKK